MAGSVTLPGASGTITLAVGGSSSNQFLASIIRNSILLASVQAGGADLVNAVSMPGGQWSLPAAPQVIGTKAGTPEIDVAVIPTNASGTVTIPSGYQYVIDESTTATVSGANVQVISVDGPYILTGNSSLTGTGNNTVQASGTYQIYLGGSGTNNVTLTGQGTYSGSTGSNTILVNDTASGGSLVMSNGTDSVLASGDHVSVVASGNNSTLNAGSANGASVQALGTGDQVIGGSGTTDVSTGGSNALVVGGVGTLSVDDSGTGDTIAAFAASTASIAAWGKSALVFAGSNPNGTAVTLAGGRSDSAQGYNTVVGGSGPTTVTLGSVTINGTVLGSGHNVVIGGSGALTVSDSGFVDTVAAFGSSSASVFAAGQSGLFIGGSHAFFASLGGGGAGSNGSNNTVAGGSGNMTVIAGGINDMIFGGSGSLSVQGAAGNAGDTIAAFSASSANITLANQGELNSSPAGALVFGGSGGLTVTVQDANNTIIGGSSSTNTIDLQNEGGVGAHNLVLGGSGAMSITDSGSFDTIAGFGASSVSATLSGKDAVFVAGSHSTTVTDEGTADTVLGGNASVTVTASAGSTGLQVFAGSGNLDFVGGANGTTVIGGSGNETFTGGTGGTTLFGGSGGGVFTFNSTTASGALDFSAGSGNETLLAAGSKTNDFIAAGADSKGTDSLVGGSGNDTFTAGAGSDTFAAGAGQNQFVFFASQTDGMHDYITGWNATDSLFLLNYSNADSANTLMQDATISGGNLTIGLSDGTQITFNNVNNTAAFNGKILYT